MLTESVSDADNAIGPFEGYRMTMVARPGFAWAVRGYFGRTPRVACEGLACRIEGYSHQHNNTFGCASNDRSPSRYRRG